MTHSTAHELRAVMSKFASGVTVLTTPEPNVHAMTANALSSVSLDPPMILGCIARSAHMHSVAQDATSLGVSILSADQEAAARYFASPSRPTGISQFEDWPWFPGPRTGAPILVGSAGWLEGEIVHRYPGGDHTIVVARVLQCTEGELDGLLFYGGRLSPLTSALPPRIAREVA